MLDASRGQKYHIGHNFLQIPLLKTHFKIPHLILWKPVFEKTHFSKTYFCFIRSGIFKCGFKSGILENYGLNGPFIGTWTTVLLWKPSWCRILLKSCFYMSQTESFSIIIAEYKPPAHVDPVYSKSPQADILFWAAYN